MKTALLVLFILLPSSLIISRLGAADQATTVDDAAVVNSCEREASAAGCSGKTVGHGLLVCLEAYRKAQKAAGHRMTFSAGCEAALKQLRVDKKAGK